MRNLAILVVVLLVALALLSALWFGAAHAEAGAEESPPEAVANAPSGDTVTHLQPDVSPPDMARPAPAEQPRRVADPKSESGQRIAADDPIGVLVSGVVRQPDGTLVVGAEVTFTRGAEKFAGVTSATGSYAVAGLRPGEWQVTCRAAGHAVQEASFTVDARAFQKLDLALRAAFVVHVKLIDASGQPVAPAALPGWPAVTPWVLATENALTADLPLDPVAGRAFGVGQWHSLVARDGALPEGGYLGELRLGELPQRGAPPLHAALLLRGALLQSQRVAAGQQEVVFVLSPAELGAVFGKARARLLDAATGRPLHGMVARLGMAEPGESVMSDDQGHITWSGLVPGWHRLEVMGTKGLERLVRSVRVPARGEVDVGDIALAPEVIIDGSVLGPDGAPVPAGDVGWTDLDGWRAPQPFNAQDVAPIGSDGRFKIRGGRHRYLLRVHNALDFVGFAMVDARQGAPSPVVVTLTKATRVALRGAVDPLRGHAVVAQVADGVPVDVAIRGSGIVADALWLLPGTYTLEVYDLVSGRSVRKVVHEVGAMPSSLDVP